MLAEVPGLADAEDDGIQEFREASQALLWRNLLEVPRSNCVLDWFEQGILADALFTAEYQRVVDLYVWVLDAMGEPSNDMVGVVGVDIPDVVDPLAGQAGSPPSNGSGGR